MKNKLLKLILAGLVLPLIPSCASFENVEGYDGAKMKTAIRALRENNMNTRIYRATGGTITNYRYY